MRRDNPVILAGEEHIFQTRPCHLLFDAATQRAARKRQPIFYRLKQPDADKCTLEEIHRAAKMAILVLDATHWRLQSAAPQRGPHPPGLCQGIGNGMPLIYS